MHFTREPIIETVITPRDGCKLVVRSSKGADQEDYCVDAIEVVSFGSCLFLRSLERPRSFLVPMVDYEILELKETRVVLKNANNERSIKIGGGRESPVRQQAKETEEQAMVRPESIAELAPPNTQTEQAQPQSDKKRDRRRSRRRRGPSPDLRQQEGGTTAPIADEHAAVQLEPKGDEKDEDIAPSFISKLFPPPPTLIKETLNRYKSNEKEKVAIEKEVVEPILPQIEPEFPNNEDFPVEDLDE